MLQTVASLTDNILGVIYDWNIFIVHAAGHTHLVKLFNTINYSCKSFKLQDPDKVELINVIQ